MLHESSINLRSRGLARLCTTAAFFLDGIIFSTWVTRIPAIQDSLHLNNATLGLALLMISLAALISMPITGRVAARFGSRHTTVAASALFAITLVPPALSIGFTSLSITLLIFGACLGALNVSANAQAVSIEHHYGRPILASFHAAFSFGGITGGLLGSLAAAHQLSPPVHFSAVAFPSFIVAIALWPFLIEDVKTAEPIPTAKPASALRPLIYLGTLGFACMLGEGAMADWSAVFLRQVSLASASTAAVGYAAFSLCMTLGRLVTDRVTTLLNPMRVVRMGGALAATGLALAIVSPASSTAIIGFALVGAGLAAIVPTVISAAGRTPGITPSVAIATASTTGFFGFLLGPPLIGFIAQATSLRWAMLLVFAAACTAIALARHVDVGARMILPTASQAPEMPEPLSDAA